MASGRRDVVGGCPLVGYGATLIAGGARLVAEITIEDGKIEVNYVEV